MHPMAVTFHGCSFLVNFELFSHSKCADKKGQPLAVDNKKNYPSNQQYFPQVPDVIKAMKKGLELFSGGQRKKEEPEKPVNVFRTVQLSETFGNSGQGSGGAEGTRR